MLEPEHDHYRSTVRGFIDTEVAPHMATWDEQGRVDRSLFSGAAKLGLLGSRVPNEFGGPGVQDWRFSAILIEELCYAGLSSIASTLALQNDIVLPYLLSLGDHDQKQQWLPGVVAGEVVLAVAMTEPGTGSDLSGIRTSAKKDGDAYTVNGAKTFISNGQNGDLYVVVVRTGEDRHRGLSLLLVPRDTSGFSVGRNLDKLGQHAQDTSELVFEDAQVPMSNLLGAEGRGFEALVSNLPEERLVVAVMAVAASEGIFDRTLAYIQQRKAFGRSIGSFQNSRFVMAEFATELSIARTYLDRCIADHLDGRLTAIEAAKAKWWTTELQCRLADRCLQLHGGYGYMREYPIARDYADARAQTIYGGTTEIMKEIVGRALGL